MRYILLATAKWTAGIESLMKSRPQPPDEIVTQELSVNIVAKTRGEARALAQRALREFKRSLPKEWQGGLSWNSEPVIVSTTLAEVISFVPGEDIVAVKAA